MRAHNLAMGWKMFQEVRSVFFEAKTFDERLLPKVPVTLVRGERSPVGSREMTAQLAKRAPHAKVIELSGTGHMAPLTHPQKVHEALRAHFGQG
jgi:pimeloyl-ACP methyl ester carboxylesterase